MTCMDSYVGRKEKQHSVKTILVCGCRKYPPGIPVDALYHLCLFRIDDEIPICILGVAEEVIVIYLYLAILVAKLESQLHILTEGL